MYLNKALDALFNFTFTVAECLKLYMLVVLRNCLVRKNFGF